MSSRSLSSNQNAEPHDDCWLVGWLVGTSIKYEVERDEQYLPYIELGRWLCSHFQLETPLNFHKPITQKLYNLEKSILHHWIP